MLSPLTEVAIWTGQMAENEIEVPGDHLKHRFLVLNQVEFGLVQGRKIGSKCHGSP